MQWNRSISHRTLQYCMTVKSAVMSSNDDRSDTAGGYSVVRAGTQREFCFSFSITIYVQYVSLNVDHKG